MDETEFAALEFPACFCGVCARLVLVYCDVDAAGNDVRRCVVCEGELTTEVEWIHGRRLEHHGYGLVVDPASCSAGCRSCGACCG